jgi:hypothetical protein
MNILYTGLEELDAIYLTLDSFYIANSTLLFYT